VSAAAGPPLHDPDVLARELGPAERWLVVLDFDGTLSPIVAHPEDAAPAAGAVDAIRDLLELTEVAVVSGRPVAELRARLGPLPVTFAGGHGAEVVAPDGTVTTLVDDPDQVTGVLDAAERDVHAAVADAEGWQVERKDASLAVHHRRADPDDREQRLPRVRAALAAHRDAPPRFELLEGKAVVELRPRGIDKGRALARIVERSSGPPPLVLGDDVTDEDAFGEAERLGGAGILVSDTGRGTVARWRLRDPSAVVTFLRGMTAHAPGG
jgi:trehalose 6-phosphate phosphatase